MKKVYTIFVLFLLMIGAGFTCIRSQPDDINYEDAYISVWEIHPGYIRITDMETINQSEPPDYIVTKGKAMIPGDRAYDIEMSPNVKDYKAEYRTEKYSGRTFEYLSFIITPNHEIQPYERFTYYISFKAERMPHLHGEKGKNRLLSIGRDPTRKFDKDIVVVAIPKGSDVTRVYDFQPYKRDKIDGWQLYYYDTTKIEQHISIHISFNQITDTDKPIDIQDLFSKAL